METHLALKQTIKWVIIPLGFCGIGYFVLAPLIDNSSSTKYVSLIQNSPSTTKTNLSVNSTLKKENKEPINDIEFTVEDITPQETTPPNQSITPNFPQSNPKKTKRKNVSPPPNVQVVEEISEVNVIEEPNQQPQDSEL